MHEWMIYLDLHVGISKWREQLHIRSNRPREKGLWDATLERSTLILKDGRRLTYFLDGGIGGGQQQQEELPHIFVFHAMFLSGNSFLMTQAPLDYVLVCVNRPGYFGSDPPTTFTRPSTAISNSNSNDISNSSNHNHNDNHSNDISNNDSYSYQSFASDIAQLADHLGLDAATRKFAVAGHSSGGPCSLACAAHLPSRVSAVGILSGDPEYAHEAVPNKRRINHFCLGYFLPFCLRYILGCLPLARNSVCGIENDFRLETSPYTFRTESIQQPTVVFVGETDRVLPLEVSRHVHERLPNVAEVRTVRKVGHLGLLRDSVLKEFFAALLDLSVDESNGSENTLPAVREKESNEPTKELL